MAPKRHKTDKHSHSPAKMGDGMAHGLLSSCCRWRAKHGQMAPYPTFLEKEKKANHPMIRIVRLNDTVVEARRIELRTFTV